MLMAMKWNSTEEFLKHIELSEKLRQLSEDQASVKAALVQTLPDYITLDATEAEHTVGTISEPDASAQPLALVTCP